MYTQGFHRPAPKKAVNRFIDPALLIAKQQITRYWKSRKGPSFEVWQSERIKWAKAGSEILQSEAARGLRKPELPQAWDPILLALQARREESVEEENGGYEEGGNVPPAEAGNDAASEV